MATGGVLDPGTMGLEQHFTDAELKGIIDMAHAMHLKTAAHAHGARGILASKVKLGGDASVAAGPVGRDASADTDASLRSEILSYSRARGLFAGVSLEGSTIRPDNGDNQRVYGKKIPAREIVLSGTVAVPPAAEQFISTLDAKTPKHGK